MTSPTSPRRRLDQFAGFTLIEILLVSALLGLLVAIVMPNLKRSVRGQGLDVGASEFASVIRYGRAEALRQRATLRLEFNEARTSYWLSSQNTSAAGVGTFRKFDESLLQDGVSFPQGIRIKRVLLDGQPLKGNFVQFEPGGVSGSVVFEVSDNMERARYVELGPWYDEVFVTREEPETIAP